MYILNPASVQFGEVVLDHVVMVLIDHATVREAVEWSDAGPHPVWADAPEQRATITVTMEIASGELTTPRPGQSGLLTIRIGANRSQSAEQAVSAQVVVLRAKHEVGGKRGALRVIECVAVSADGIADPIVIGE